MTDPGDQGSSPAGGASASIVVAVDDPAWTAALDDAVALSRRAVAAALAAAGPDAGVDAAQAVEISVVLTDDARVAALNAAYRGRAGPTNVLSFPTPATAVAPPGAPRLLGDVVLARETVAAEAAAQGKRLAEHVTHLLVHGTLHLLGRDHQDATEAATMEALEATVLRGLGIADPYAVAEATE